MKCVVQQREEFKTEKDKPKVQFREGKTWGMVV
jgi:hypothetical protein